jgi:hypothetical protein
MPLQSHGKNLKKKKKDVKFVTQETNDFSPGKK